MLALLWECIHHFPLPWAGENSYCVIWYCAPAHRMIMPQTESRFILKWMFSLFAGYLCCFCLCCLHSGYLLFNFCSFALAVFCGKHLCIIQLHMAHRWVCGLLCFFCSVFALKYHKISQTLFLFLFVMDLLLFLVTQHLIKLAVVLFEQVWQCSSHLIMWYFSAEKGICISTVSLWILLVYTEASLRLKDLKTSHANLSHLFAAHWYVDLNQITLSWADLVFNCC